MNRLERAAQRYIHDLTVGPARRPRRQRPETAEPGERGVLGAPRLLAAYALAVVLPVATAAALVPVRDDHGRTTAIVLVLPVVVVAVLGATGPAVVAALAAGLAYDVLLTEPYHHVVISDTDDVVAALTLVAVALAVGLLSSRLIRLTARDTARRGELRHLLAFAHAATTPRTDAELTTEACRDIAAVLGLRECRWQPGYHGTAAPVLQPTGEISGYLTGLEADRAQLPPRVELPAVAGTVELGRFVLTSTGDHASSVEERLTAATIAALFANAMVDQPSSGAGGIRSV
ncbi:MAG TPA: DUF4118 domain-containing protein [Acidimicrobiales bacterium]